MTCLDMGSANENSEGKVSCGISSWVHESDKIHGLGSYLLVMGNLFKIYIYIYNPVKICIILCIYNFIKLQTIN